MTVDPLEAVFADLPPVLSVEQCAQFLGRNPVTIRRWLDRGAIPGHQIDRTWVIFTAEWRAKLAADAAIQQRVTVDPRDPGE